MQYRRAQKKRLTLPSAARSGHWEHRPAMGTVSTSSGSILSIDTLIAFHSVLVSPHRLLSHGKFLEISQLERDT